MSSAEDVIAIDGPAGTGKSTVARRVARRLGRDYIDTGAMYRCVCLKALRQNCPLEDTDRLVNLARRTEIDMEFEAGELTVFMDGKEVTEAIRSTEVDQNVSDVARIPGVRETLVNKQRDMGQSGEVVMEGRDIGTVVFPGVKHKFYLEASLEVRAERRYTELRNSGHDDVDYQTVLREMDRRDTIDRSRSTSPLKAAEDAIRIDTSNLTVEEVVNEVLEHLEFTQ